MPDRPSPARRPARRRVATALLTIAFAILMAGCSFSCSIGGDPTVSSTEMANQIEASYVEQTGIELESISCEETPAEVGGEISCEATNASEVRLVIEGEVTAVEERDKVKFDWEVVSAQVPGAHYAQAAERVLEQQTGRPVSSVDCPELVDLKNNGEFRCTVVAPDGTEIGATLTMTDEDGGFDIKVDPAPSASPEGDEPSGEGA